MYFFEFVDRKQRETLRHLGLIERLIAKTGKLQAEKFFEEEEPYLYVKTPIKSLGFDGIRIYEIGDMIAYRIQKENKTLPIGSAYPLNIEDMFNDFMGENMKEDEAGHKVIENIVLELVKFFEKSAKAEEELDDSPVQGPPTLIKSAGNDYSSLVLGKLN
jgi:hypothetical protein